MLISGCSPLLINVGIGEVGVENDNECIAVWIESTNELMS